MITSVREWAGSPFDRTERFVTLQLEEMTLVVMQAEVVALEPALDVQTTNMESLPDHANAAGYLPLANGACPVYALDANLQSVARVPEAHRICAVMRNRDGNYALSCIAVQLVARGEIVVYATPRSMLNTRSPILQLLVHDGKLLLGTTAAAVYAHLDSRADADVISFEQRIRRIRS